jgi:translation initiation factor IF-3
MAPKIDDHDIETKIKAASRFLDEGDKLKVTVRFRGREMAHPDRGRALLLAVGERLKDHGVIERMPLLEGRQMIMVMNPVRAVQVQNAPGTAAAAAATAAAVRAAPASSPAASSAAAPVARPAAGVPAPQLPPPTPSPATSRPAAAARPAPAASRASAPAPAPAATPAPARPAPARPPTGNRVH